MAEWQPLVAVLIPAAALVSLMIYVKSISAGHSPGDIWAALLATWAGLLATVGVIILSRSVVADALVEVDTLSPGLRLAELDLSQSIALGTSLLLTVLLWRVLIVRLRRILGPPPQDHSELQQECRDNGGN